MSSEAQRPLRGTLLHVSIAATYFAAGKLGLALALVNDSTSAVWPPTGIALAALLLFGRRVAPAIFAGAFLVNLTTSGSVPASLLIGLGNLLEGLVGAWLVLRLAGGRRAFDRPGSVLQFVGLAAGVAPTVSATIGVCSLCLLRLAAWPEFGAIWSTWWLGDATGALVAAPLCVLWAEDPRVRWPRRQALEAAALFGGLIAVSLVVFGSTGAARGGVPLDFLCLPFPLWAAFRFGRREAATTNSLLAAIAIFGTVQGWGPFVRESPNHSLLLLQAYLAVQSVIALATAAIVYQRGRVEQALRAAGGELEARVAERTESLSHTVSALEVEVRERVRAERELRESELRLRGLLEAVPDAMVVVDAYGTIIQVTAQAEQVFGYARQDMLGRAVELLVPERFRDRHHDYRGGFTADPRTRLMGADLELFGLRQDGTEFPVEISLSPVRTEHGVLITAAIRDITERKAVEQQIRRLNMELERRVRERTADLERSNEALREFAYVASHDLQEPLRTVANFAELLARRYRGRLGADADEFIGFIVEGAQRMHQLLADLLQYARIDSRPPRLGHTDFDAALDRALANLGAAVGETAAQITRGRLPVLAADEVQMVQLLQNLVGNAIKFRRHDVRPEVHVEAEPRETGWVFSVQDNGIGIDPRHAERIFGVFQRLHRREEYPGTGVGLAICRKIVERHGGRVWVDAAPAGGSVLRFTLPGGEIE